MLVLLVTGVILMNTGRSAIQPTTDVHSFILDRYYERWNKTEVQPTIPGGTVFLGTSLTAYFHFHLLRDEGYINRGWPGDFVRYMPRRLDEIISLKPRRLFIEAGVNDIMSSPFYDAIPYYLITMIKKVRKELPGTKIYLQSILPVRSHPNFMMTNALFNSIIVRINTELKSLSKEYAITFVNLYPLFEKDGEMNPELTTDGVHLRIKGYGIWEKALLPYLCNAESK
jgi:hexosaminidase